MMARVGQLERQLQAASAELKKKVVNCLIIDVILESWALEISDAYFLVLILTCTFSICQFLTLYTGRHHSTTAGPGAWSGGCREPYACAAPPVQVTAETNA